MYIPINNPQGGGVDISSFSGGKACVDCCRAVAQMMLATIIHSSYKHGNTNQRWRDCHDGEQTGLQRKIFYPHMNLEQRIPWTHLLRRIQEQIDFNFIYAEVKTPMGVKAMSLFPSCDPEDDVAFGSLQCSIGARVDGNDPMRLDWLWFLGYDIDSEVPDHSVLSKAGRGGE